MSAAVSNENRKKYCSWSGQYGRTLMTANEREITKKCLARLPLILTPIARITGGLGGIVSGHAFQACGKVQQIVLDIC